MRIGGRLHAAQAEALVGEPRLHDGRILQDLGAPMPGFFRPITAYGEGVSPGTVIGELIVLGRTIAIVAARVGGTAIALVDFHGHVDHGPRAVGHGETLFTLDRSERVAGGADAGPAATAPAAGGLVFAAPLSGRFFLRPGPGKPPFVEVGAVLEPGTTVCMLEVMKTFNRVTYGGHGLPERARVAAILVADEEDVTMGQAILRLEGL